MRESTRGRRARVVRVGLPALVLLAALLVAAVEYRQYRGASRAQWGELHHDRNAFLLESMRLALDLESADLPSVVGDLHRLKLRPPLFPAAAAPLLLIGGLDYTRPALISLASWCGTILFVFLIARRAVPEYGHTAGILAATWALSSPGLRAFSTDIMLEGLGAFLVLVVIACWMRARSSWNLRSATLLALALTACFFLKYNYWAPTLVAILAVETTAWLRRATPQDRRRASDSLRRRLGAEVRQPIVLSAAALVCVAAVLGAAGVGRLAWKGIQVSGRPSLDLLYGAYVLIAVRTLLVWRRERIGDGLSPPVRRLVLLHVVPIGLWLLWPLKLQNFLWYLSPWNSEGGQRQAYGAGKALAFYGAAVLREYHPTLRSGIAAVALAAVAFLVGNRLTAPARTALVALAVPAALIVAHPNVKSRFLHPWIPLLWVAAAIGAAAILGLLRRRLGRPAAAAAAAGVLIVAVAEAAPSVRHNRWRALENRPSALDLSDAYLPRIAPYSKVAMLGTVHADAFLRWSYLARYPERRWNLQLPMTRLGRCETVEAKKFGAWLESADPDAIVFLDLPPGSFFDWPGQQACQIYRDLLLARPDIRLVERHDFPSSGAVIRILTRGSASPLTAPPVEARSSVSTGRTRPADGTSSTSAAPRPAGLRVPPSRPGS